MIYGTFLGGSSGDASWGIAVDASGNAYVTGGTNSTTFPATPGTFQTTYKDSGDAFVAGQDLGFETGGVIRRPVQCSSGTSHQRALPVRLAVQACRPLMMSSRMNEKISITTATEVAPA